ncbi:MAG: 50S ribosomal protein L21 [Nitrospiraceae bacterium]|nr:50S ribosomal protein L21 [Nitrospiraceae bacterium]
MYAIIETGGKQFMVSEGDKIVVEKLSADKGSEVKIKTVLAFFDEKKHKVGDPYIKGASVKAEVLDSGKGEKVIIHKQRARRVYRKTNGHRQPYTTLKVKEISAGG